MISVTFVNKNKSNKLECEICTVNLTLTHQRLIQVRSVINSMISHKYRHKDFTQASASTQFSTSLETQWNKINPANATFYLANWIQWVYYVLYNVFAWNNGQCCGLFYCQRWTASIQTMLLSLDAGYASWGLCVSNWTHTLDRFEQENQTGLNGIS